jgi:hypothetical protein
MCHVLGRRRSSSHTKNAPRAATEGGNSSGRLAFSLPALAVRFPEKNQQNLLPLAADIHLSHFHSGRAGLSPV